MIDKATPKANNALPCGLVRVGKFEWPHSEARQTLGRVFDKAKSALSNDVATDAIDYHDLKSISDDALKSKATELVTHTLTNLLDRKYLDWIESGDNTPQRRAFIFFPTCDDVLGAWAEHHGLTSLNPDDDLSKLPNKSCIVIPNMEAFFSRDRDQLTQILDLFTQLAEHGGPVLAGCSSWAWRFLRQFKDPDLLFSDAHIFPAFDADVFATILEQAVSETDNQKAFMSVATGNSILQRDKNGALEDSYLKKLAGHSIGHPRVAVEMFFRAIAETKEDKKDARPSDDIIWVDLPDACFLPASARETSLFALQALMIHGPRSIEELNALLPPRGSKRTLDEFGTCRFP